MLELLSTTLQQFRNPINIFLSILLAYRVYKLLPSFRFSELEVESPDGRNINSESTVTATTGSVDSISLSESTIEYHERPSKFPETLVWRTYTPLELQHFDGKNGTRIVSDSNSSSSTYTWHPFPSSSYVCMYVSLKLTIPPVNVFFFLFFFLFSVFWCLRMGIAFCCESSGL
jgi:hypothetical protein